MIGGKTNSETLEEVKINYVESLQKCIVSELRSGKDLALITKIVEQHEEIVKELKRPKRTVRKKVPTDSMAKPSNVAN